MGLESLAAGLVVTVKDRTARGVAAIGRGFKTMKTKGAQLGQAMSALAPAFAIGAVGAAALGIAVGVAGKKALNFEKQLSAVQAVSDPLKASTFPALTQEIKRLGATTQFSATEAAQGAENLTRAGFDTTETIAGLSGVMNAAAADGIDLATSARLIANNVRAFGLEATDATHVADVLANTSAKSNTNMVELGEGLKFTAPIARALGVSLEDTAASLGLLADAGLQGSTGGTAFKNALLKLAKPSAAGAKLMKKYKFAVQTAADGSVNMAATLSKLMDTMKKIPKRTDKVAFATEVFGIRGQAAMLNFLGAVEGKEGGFQAALDRLQSGTEGAAKRMAEIRLDNVLGSFTLLGSALEGLAIEVFTDKAGTLKTGIKDLAGAIGVVVETMQQLDDGFIIESESMEKFRKKFGPITDDLIQFGIGLRQGLDILKEGINEVSKFGKKVIETFGGSGSDIAKGLGMFVVLAVPVIIALGAIFTAATIIAIPFLAAGAAIVGVLKVIGVGLVAVLISFGLFAGVVNDSKREGESFKDAFVRVFGDVKTFALDFVEGFKVGIDQDLLPAFESMKQASADLAAAVEPIFDSIGDSFGGMGDDGRKFGKTFTFVVGGIAKILSWLVSKIFAPVIAFFVDNFVAGMISGIGDIIGGFADLITGATSVSNGLLRIFGGIGKVLFGALLVPIRGALDLAIKAAEEFGLGDSEIIGQAKSALEVLRFKEGPTAAGQRGPKFIKGFGQNR